MRTRLGERDSAEQEGAGRGADAEPALVAPAAEIGEDAGLRRLPVHRHRSLQDNERVLVVVVQRDDDARPSQRELDAQVLACRAGPGTRVQRTHPRGRWPAPPPARASEGPRDARNPARRRGSPRVAPPRAGRRATRRRSCRDPPRRGPRRARPSSGSAGPVGSAVRSRGCRDGAVPRISTRSRSAGPCGDGARCRRTPLRARDGADIGPRSTTPRPYASAGAEGPGARRANRPASPARSRSRRPGRLLRLVPRGRATRRRWRRARSCPPFTPVGWLAPPTTPEDF